MRKKFLSNSSSAMSRVLNMLLMAIVVVGASAMVACSGGDEPEPADTSYVDGVKTTTYKETVVNGSEQMLTVAFETDNGYVLDTDNSAMVNFFDGGSSTKAGKQQARIQLCQNDTGAERTATIYITVTGHNRTTLTTIIQKAGASDEVVIWVDERLQTEYYWLDEYNEKHTDFDFTLSYDKFLSESLLSLTTNEDDGGRYSNGERYIYSYIQMISGTNASSSTRAADVSGYGLELASMVWTLQDGGYGYAVEHVYPGSSAEKGGIRRGDIISQVKGQDISQSNLNEYWYGLLVGSLGSSVTVQKLDGSTQEPATVELTLSNYQQNPVAHCGVIKLPESVADSGKKIGYLSYLSFDADFDTELLDALTKLQAEGITDMILDLRSNGGGSVNSSILLASSILGSSHEGSVYATLKRHEKNKYGNSVCKIVSKSGTTSLPSLNMPALWVIGSGNTASASEMVIMGLRGLDIPVTLVGAKTEGKNCGMDVMEKTIGSATYEYAPITFINVNAKGFSEYGEGIDPDIDINSYMNKSTDENVQYFARVYPMPCGEWGATNKDLALMETVMKICGKSVLDKESASAEFTAMKRPEVAQSATRAGEPIKLQPKRKVFGAMLRQSEREQLERQ